MIITKETHWEIWAKMREDGDYHKVGLKHHTPQEAWEQLKPGTYPTIWLHPKVVRCELVRTEEPEL